MSENALQELRERITGVDREIIRLLNERASLSLQIGRIKKEAGREIYDPSQEENIYRNIVGNTAGVLPDCSLKNIFREIISSSRALQAPVSVAYLGPEASFSHQAALAHFGNSITAAPRAAIADVFNSVEKKENDWGIVPIENSTEGSVKATLDRLIATPLVIRAEVFLRIRLCLLSNCNERGDIQKVYSHPQALAQSQQWLRRYLPVASLIEVESTAGAARRALADPSGAAVGSSLAADFYNLKIMAEGIEDSPLNTTRFFVIGTKPARQEAGDTEKSKTSILFGTAHAAGALQHALAPFAGAGISLTRIESWPMKERLWEYLFFADFTGHVEEEKTRRCLEELRGRTAFLKILGSYPRGAEGEQS
ncbi:MAG: prephenate dehydratase [Syntrophales bacterium]|jgi:chorismate mutase/prephenate dehydratase|nr:prephenate dehydratase [Syntrophales bacterium]